MSSRDSRKERHIFMETKNIKVGGGRLSRLLGAISQARREDREGGEREQQGGWRHRAHGCIGVNLCLQEFT